MTTIHKICRHCYNLSGRVALSYENQTSHNREMVRFDSSAELLRALINDNMVSESGELVINSCLRFVVSDQGGKVRRTPHSEFAAVSDTEALDETLEHFDHQASNHNNPLLDDLPLPSESIDYQSHVLDFLFDAGDEVSDEFINASTQDFSIDEEFGMVDVTDLGPVAESVVAGNHDHVPLSTTMHSPTQCSVSFAQGSHLAEVSKVTQPRPLAPPNTTTEQQGLAGEVDIAGLRSHVVNRASDDAVVAMEELMGGKPVLLHVIRRYGCGICRQHARELSLLKPALDNFGVGMIAIGRGTAGLKKWKKAGYWQGDLFYEPADGRVSRTLGLTAKGSALGLFEPKVLREVLKTGVGNLSRDEGDYWNLAGTFVLSKDSKILYALRQKTFADTPKIEDLMHACRKAAGFSRMKPGE